MDASVNSKPKRTKSVGKGETFPQHPVNMTLSVVICGLGRYPLPSVRITNHVCLPHWKDPLITWQCEWSKTTPTHVLNVLGATCGTPVSLIGGSLMSTDAEKDLWVTEPGSLVWRPVFLWFWLACYQCYLSWSSKSYISFSAAKEKLKERLKRELWVRPNTYHKGWLITLENV